MRKVIVKIGLVFIGLILGYLVAELYFRIFNPQLTFNKITTPYNFHCYHSSEFYWNGLKPNSNCQFHSNANAFSDFTVSTNSLGLRGPEVTIPKPKNTYRILILGDSFTFGLGVPDDKSFPRIIEKILADKLAGKRLEVINAGLPGTGPGYDYLFLKNWLEELQPDFVVVGYFIQNDVPDQIYSIWEGTDKRGLPTKIINSAVYIDNPSGQMLPKKIGLKYQIPVFRNSNLFIFLFDTFFPKATFSNLYVMTPTNPVITPETCLYKKACRDLDEAKANVRKFFTAMKDLTSNQNGQFLVVFIPAEYQINNRDVTHRYNIYVPLLPSDKEYPYQEFSQFFQSQRINYLDIRDNLRKIDLVTPLYFYNDNHWNENGHQAAAQLISSKILEQLSIDEQKTAN